MNKKIEDEFPKELFCPMRQTIKILGKRWTILIIKEIYYSPKKKLGFMDLRRLMPDVSTKVLSQRLKEMVSDNLLKRKANNKVTPLRVNYSLTQKGKDACTIIEDFKAYGLKWASKNTRDCSEMDCELCSKKRQEEIDEKLQQKPPPV